LQEEVEGLKEEVVGLKEEVAQLKIALFASRKSEETNTTNK